MMEELKVLIDVSISTVFFSYRMAQVFRLSSNNSIVPYSNESPITQKKLVGSMV